MNGTYVEIDLDNLENNVKTLKSDYDDYEYYIGVLKSDCYGHGPYIVNTLVKSGINYIAVSSIDEGILVRVHNRDIPILILEPIMISELKTAIEYNFTLTVHDLDYIKELDKVLNKKVKVHLKVDSGMNRLGIKDKHELKEAYDIMNKNKLFEIEGIYSHFATTGVFDKKWDYQLDEFKEITSLVDLSQIPIKHLGSSIILLAHPKIDFCNAIRIGTLLYGYNISPRESNRGFKNRLRVMRNRYFQKKYNISKTFTNVELNLKPCMSFYTNILQIKKVKADESIGYGVTSKQGRETLVVIIPVGYNNGIGTKNINRYVAINEKKYRILSIGMNMSVIEVDSRVSITDKVTILDNKTITIGALARGADTTFHEVLLNIGKSNKKVYIKNGKIVFIEE